MSVCRVALVGPCSPMGVADLLCEADAAVAREYAGYRGVPVESLARALVSLGLQVSVVTCDYSRGPRRYSRGSRYLEFSGPGFNFVQLPGRPYAKLRGTTYFGAEVSAMQAALRATDADVVHAHWTYEFAMAALESGLPALVTAHDDPAAVLRQVRDVYRLQRYLLSLKVASRVRRLTVVSPYLLPFWQKHVRPGVEILVVPNINSLQAADTPRTAGAGLRVVSIGDSGRRKNIAGLLRAWQMVSEVVPDSELTLIGPGLDVGGGLRESQGRSPRLGNVRWLGPLGHSEIRAVIDASTLMVHPSLEESQGLSLIEAMSRGVPAIAGSNAGGVPWTLGDAGLLVDTRDPSAIASAILQVHSNPSLYAELSVRGLERVKREFDPLAGAANYLTIYEKIHKEHSTK